MSTPADFPASDTEPKVVFQPSSSITPLPRLPHLPIDKAKGFGWAGFATAIVSILFWVVKELGGLGAAASWLRALSPLMGLALALVFIVAAGVFFGMQILAEMRADREGMWQIVDGRDKRQTDILNEQSSILAELRTLVAELAHRLMGLERSVRKQVLTGPHETLTPDPDETITGRHRRLNQR